MIIPKTLEDCKSQHEAILFHLNHFSTGLAQYEAKELYGIERLPARIFDLREYGFEIVTVMEKGKNRFGNPTNYGRYYLKERSI